MGCPEIGGPGPIWWLSGVCARRARDGAQPLAVVGPVGPKRRNVDSVGLRAWTPNISPHRIAGGGTGAALGLRPGPQVPRLRDLEKAPQSKPASD